MLDPVLSIRLTPRAGGEGAPDSSRMERLGLISHFASLPLTSNSREFEKSEVKHHTIILLKEVSRKCCVGSRKSTSEKYRSDTEKIQEKDDEIRKDI